MTRPTITQKQLITLRQGALILAIFLLSVFAFKYAQNVMRIRAAQDELARLEKAVDDVRQKQKIVDEDFANSSAPAAIEAFSKREMGWVQQGEILYIPVPGASSAEETEPSSGNPTPRQETAPPNWRLWLALITDAGD